MKHYIINISKANIVVLMFVLLSSCIKDPIQPGPLSQAPSGLAYAIQGPNVQVSWTKPSESFDNYTLEWSKFEDFSILEGTQTINKDEEQHILRSLGLGENHFVRIRTNRISPQGFSEWTGLRLTTNPADILLPISSEDINGTTVTLKWEFPTLDDPNFSKSVTRVVLTPAFGEAKEVSISTQNQADQSLQVTGLQKDMQYTVRIYNQYFARGTQMFTTIAEAVNGVWNLSPHSDLKSAVELSVNGDQIVLKPGVYNFWNSDIEVINKSIVIKAADNQQKPKVYVKGFLVDGASSGVEFKGIDFSGSRITEFKQEIPNTPDTRWNSWLITIKTSSLGFDAIKFDDCVIRNYYTGLLRMVEGQTGNNLTINNSIVKYTGGDAVEPFIKTIAARLKVGVFTNSTYYMNNKMFIAIDREKNLSNDIDFTFKNNTVDNSWAAMAFDFKASKAPTKALFENNIFSNITCAANFFNNFAHVANNFDKRLINCNFFNVRSKATIYGSNSSNMPIFNWELRHPNNLWNEVKPAFVMNDASHANPNSVKEYPVAIDPQYEDAENLNFKISANSGLRMLDGGKPVGDPRWW